MCPDHPEAQRGWEQNQVPRYNHGVLGDISSGISSFGRLWLVAHRHLNKTWPVKLCIWSVGYENPGQGGCSTKPRVGGMEKMGNLWSVTVTGVCVPSWQMWLGPSYRGAELRCADWQLGVEGLVGSKVESTKCRIALPPSLWSSCGLVTSRANGHKCQGQPGLG